MLKEYKEAHNGSVEIEIPEISEDEKENPRMKDLHVLRNWCTHQLNLYRRVSLGYNSLLLTDEKIEKMEEIGMLEFLPSYDDMYNKLIAHKAETGTLDVDKDADPELFKWIKEQKRFLAQHFEGKKDISLSDERIKNLIALGYKRSNSPKSNVRVFDQGSLDAKWEAMFDALAKYKEEHGSLSFPNSKESPKEIRKLKFWLDKQKAEFRKVDQGKESSLTARRLHRLTCLGVELDTKHEYIPWEERMRSLQEFHAEHGHMKPNKFTSLGQFVSNVRTFYKEKMMGRKSCLTDERIVSVFLYINLSLHFLFLSILCLYDFTERS